MSEDNEVVESKFVGQGIPVVVDSKPIPKILDKMIDDSNYRLQVLHRDLNEELSETAKELMELMGLEVGEWFLDIKNRKFVKLGKKEDSDT